MLKKILITGASGMLGKDIARHLGEYSNWEVFGISRNPTLFLPEQHQILGDLTDPVFLEKAMLEIRPHVIVHCAANTNVNDCENNKEFAYRLHVQTTQQLATFAPDQTRLIYISSDAVFDGESGHFKEDDPVSPVNYYAQTKYEGEQAALSENAHTLVLRTNIYGFHHPPGISLVEWALANLSENQSINGFNDVFFNPVYTGQLARFIQSSIEHSTLAGILHVGCPELVSKYEFLIRLARKFGFSTKLINPISVDEMGFKAKRPKNTSLDIKKLKIFTKDVYSLNSGLSELTTDYQTRSSNGKKF